MDEIFRICDFVSVLRDGKHVATEAIAQTNRQRLIRQMVGRDVLAKRPNHLDLAPGEEILRVENLSSIGKFEKVSLAVRRNEIVGMAGRGWAGRSAGAVGRLWVAIAAGRAVVYSVGEVALLDVA